MIGAYFARHMQVFVSSLGKLAYSPLASFMTILVIAITLALPAALHVMVKNALQVTGGWQDAVDFSAYLQPDVSLDTANNLAQLLRSRADIEDITVISADAALAGFAEQSGFGDALDSLEANPLPHTLVVRPLASLTPEASDLLRQELDGLPETDVVQLDTEWIARFQAILNLVRRAIWIAGGALGLGLLVVIGNTIRLDIQNRRDEIEIMQLIGASDPFIRRPFLYTGLWYGLGGGLLALGLLAVMLSLLGGPVSQLAGLYGSGWSLLGPNLQEIGAIVAVGVTLGLGGSWFATARHMRRIDPK